MRFYLSKLTGSGIESDKYRPMVDNYIKKWRAIDGRKDPTTGAGRVFVECSPTDAEHQAIIADPGITYIPIEGAGGVELSKNDPLSSIQNRVALITALEARGIPLDGLVGTDPVKRLMRRIIRKYLIRQMLKGDDFGNALDADEAPQKLLRIKALLEAQGFTVPADLTPRKLIRAIRRQANSRLRTQYDD